VLARLALIPNRQALPKELLAAFRASPWGIIPEAIRLLDFVAGVDPQVGLVLSRSAFLIVVALLGRKARHWCRACTAGVALLMGGLVPTPMASAIPARRLYLAGLFQIAWVTGAFPSRCVRAPFGPRCAS